VKCTLPTQFSDFAEQVTALQGKAPATAEELDTYLGELATVALTADALRSMIGTPDLFPAAAHSATAISAWSSSLDMQRNSINVRPQGAVLARDAEIGRIAAERRAINEAARVAAEAEATRVAAEAEAARVAADKAVADAAAAARKRAAAKSTTTSRCSGSSSGSSGSSSSGSTSGYTGCRAYAPGGKSWTPIPCP
jgi:micrococcal nuclease